jgi:FkbM family methyltransferase
MKYQTTIEEFDLDKWGKAKFANWHHPSEQRKVFAQSDIDWISNFIKPGDTVIDIGAYTGDTALPYAVTAGPTGQVLAFEPNLVSLEILLQNSTLNPQFATIWVIPYAVGVRREERIFHYHCGQINGGYLTEGEPVTVKCVRLDSFPEKPSFVKIDCEGEDGLLLAEYTSWLKASKAVVQVERFPTLNPDQCAMLWAAITNYGTPTMEGDWTFTKLKQLPDRICNIIINPNE